MTCEFEYHRTKSLLLHLHMGIIKHLDSKPGVHKIESNEKPPAERPAIIAWEQRNTTFLPEDLKNFFMTSDGFNMNWSVVMETGTVPVGRLHVNGIGQLQRLDLNSDAVSSTTPNVSILDPDSDDDTDNPSKPKFSGGFRIFELDPCNGYGKVCMVYRDSKPTTVLIAGEMTSEIWFLDRALGWHYLAATFTDYFRLMIMHLGLPHWQYAFTDFGVPPQSKQWFHLYAQVRFEIDLHCIADVKAATTVNAASKTLFDPSKVFKGKNEKKKVTGTGQSGSVQNANTSSTHNRSKKPPVSSARSASSLGAKPLSSSSSTQSLIKSSR
ncbi:tubulin polyglutamylase complex subunit 2-like isoform X1 [Pomacea canaliculata]|uniref:tubulin polyglutamylase complex subunit 2-like isoform X1 n=2 Tax=Pomacea canaliculata TaxID=400727 RepID=UPI000D73A23E|nr:tubulin polyglutamylase complex subunit 2-like isoform X1 [Pomacea canaliculata]